MYSDYEIREIPTGYAPARKAVEAFLQSHGLTLDRIDYYAAVCPVGTDRIVAAGGLLRDAIRCIATESNEQDEHFAARLVSHLMAIVRRRGYPTVKVFTKSENRTVFESLAFKVIAETHGVVFMENSLQPLHAYLDSLRKLRRSGTSGVIVMNCNPFTLGHRYLVSHAAREVDNLYIIPLLDSADGFTYEERREMILRGTRDIANVTVCEGSAYSVSRVTFPTYFIKRTDDATDRQIDIDLEVFARYIAPALGATVRFVGTEPLDPLTRRYNDAMLRTLPRRGIDVRVVERLEGQGKPVSASATRTMIAANRMHAAMEQVPPTSRPFIMAKFATDALCHELDTTPKPGLVDRHDNGAHADMDYITMRRGIEALRPWFVRLATLGAESPTLLVADIRRTGLNAERSMLAATGGVNTHRGALFSLGLTAAAAMWLYAHSGCVESKPLSELISRLASGFTPTQDTHGTTVVRRDHVGGALANATGGYRDVFQTWVPYYRMLRDDRYREQKTLLKIMTTLDDTNVYYRAGAAVAQQIKEASAAVLAHFSPSALDDMNHEFIRHNISPGGAADMLALTILVNAILR